MENVKIYKNDIVHKNTKLDTINNIKEERRKKYGEITPRSLERMSKGKFTDDDYDSILEVIMTQIKKTSNRNHKKVLRRFAQVLESLAEYFYKKNNPGEEELPVEIPTKYRNEFMEI